MNTAQQHGSVAALAAFMQEYGPAAGEDGPVRFVREVLGETPDPWQEALLRALGRGVRYISVRSGHNVGKTAVAAWCIVYHILCRYPQKTACTAPTSSQLNDALASEVKKWIGRLPQPLQVCLDIKSDTIMLKAKPAESFVTFKTARAEQPEAIAGLHSGDGFVLIVVDEASGVPEPIFEAASGSMADLNATTLLLGNPTRTSGTFFDSHHKLKDRWLTMHVHGKPGYTRGIYSARVSPEYAQDQAARYGDESNAYRVRVLGEFPRSDLDTIIPYELVASAQEREIQVLPNTPEIWGLDVAWKGDDLAALCKRRGKVVREPVRVWHNLEAMQLVGAVKAEWDACPLADRPVAINVDAINYGEAIADRLRELHLPARSINVAELPALDGRYPNVRTELWYKAKQWLSTRDCALPRDAELEADLVSTKYDILDSSGKLIVEPKKKAKKRGMRSPDRGDAFILTFAGPAITAGGLGGGVWGRRDPLKRNTKVLA